MQTWLASLFAIFIWWFSTGAILMVVKFADGKGPRTRLMAVVYGIPLLALGIWGYLASLHNITAAGAYIGFLSALAIWGWIELAFLTGIIAGPNTHPCPEKTPEWERFIRAWGTIAYHEMLLVAVLITMVLYGQGAENQFGIWTFAVLFVARISAKLNLFLGVPKINIEFLPNALAHLPSHFRHARLNWLFPISITALTFAVACWIERLFAHTSAHDIIGFALLTAITSLALLEHWFMVLPLPDEKLWRWMIPDADKPKTQKIRHEGHHGL